MMDNPLVVTAITLGLIVASAFFVMIEFALLGAREHRLEADAERSRSARAALRGINELTVMLAGAQLGITVCTFALGAVTKPAVDAWMGPVFTSWGAPAGVADVVAFALSLLLVTFLHLVVGEMAPKSWVIAHPDRAAKLIGLPSRAFVWVFRPLLVWINTMANKLVSASGVEPVERAAAGGQDADTIRQLVEHSASVGTLDAAVRTPLSGALELEELTMGALVNSDKSPTAVGRDGTVTEVQQAAARTDHMRILLLDGRSAGSARAADSAGSAGSARAAGSADARSGQPGEHPSGPEVVHVRDTLMEPDDAPARPLARPAMLLDQQTPVHEALSLARERSEQLMVVMDGERFLGVVTVSDILRRVLPEPEEAPA